MRKEVSAKAMTDEMKERIRRDPEGSRQVVLNGSGYIDGKFYTNKNPNKEKAR